MTKYLDPKVTCTADVGDAGDAEDWIRPCGKPSRFVVARSDGDSSFGGNGGSEEACEEHLSDAVLGMVDGDETVSAVITVRWGALDDATAAGGELDDERAAAASAARAARDAREAWNDPEEAP